MFASAASKTTKHFAKFSKATPKVNKRYFGDPDPHSGDAAKATANTWKYASIAGLIIVLYGGLDVYVFRPHHFHENDLPRMPYTGVLGKKYPWGDGTETFYQMMYHSKHSPKEDHGHH